MSAPILVLTSTGNIGKYVVQYLREKPGLKIRAATRDPSKFPSDDRVEYVAFDVKQPNTIESALNGVKTLFLAQPVTLDSLEEAKVIIDQAKKAGVEVIVKLSSLRPWDYKLGRTHLAIEEYVRESGIPLVSLRPTSFYSNLEGDAATIKSQSATYSIVGTTPFARIDNRDVGEAAANILAAPQSHIGKNYSLTGDVLNDEQVAQIYSRLLNKPIKYIQIEDEACTKTLEGFGIPPKIVEELVDLFAACRAGACNYTYNHVELLTGHKPRTLESWVSENINNFQ